MLRRYLKPNGRIKKKKIFENFHIQDPKNSRLPFVKCYQHDQMESAGSTRKRQKKLITALVWKTEGKTPTVGPRIRWKNYSETDLVR